MLTRDKPFADRGPILYLIGTPIGNLKDISERALSILETADIVAAEDTRSTGQLLARYGIKPTRLVSCFAQKEAAAAPRLLAEVKECSLTLAYVSDAGNPGISDPGALLVKAALKIGVSVSAVTGPSAFIPALTLSGFDTSDFSFYGFLPAKSGARTVLLSALAARTETLIFYESPHRLLKTLGDMTESFGHERRAVVAREISKIHEEYIRGSLGELLADFPADALRGEFVIVVEGAPLKAGEPDAETVAEELQKKLAAGNSLKESVDLVAAEMRLARNLVYDIARKRYGR